MEKKILRLLTLYSFYFLILHTNPLTHINPSHSSPPYAPLVYTISLRRTPYILHIVLNQHSHALTLFLFFGHLES